MGREQVLLLGERLIAAVDCPAGYRCAIVRGESERKVIPEMRKIKIVADSSANLLTLSGCAFASAPLKINTADGHEFIDARELDAVGMVSFFDTYKGKSKTSCPNTADWLGAFDGAEDIFCVTITSGLSGSYNSACAAREIYESEHPGTRVCVIDSLSTGPEMELIVEKLLQWIEAGKPYEEICADIQTYMQHTELVFMLESLKNFAANGRVSPAVAKVAGLLGIRVVGRASEAGQLQPLNKCRGQVRSLDTILTYMKEQGLQRGKVRIAHCMNQPAAEQLAEMIRDAMPETEISIRPCRGLCCYYAEKGGLLVGFEKK